MKSEKSLKLCLEPTDSCFGIEKGRVGPGAMAPYFIPSSPEQKSTKTAILVHGLSDSPFYMKDIAAQLHFNGFNVLSVLLSGHGNPLKNGPDELGSKTSWEDWVDDLNFSVLLAERFSHSIVLVGFSTGGSLITQLISEEQYSPKISKAVLISPALKLFASKTEEFFSGILWGLNLGIKDYGKGVRYQYYPAGAVKELTRLNKKVQANLERTDKIDTPIFTIFSGSDDAIDVARTDSLLRNHSLNYNNLVVGEIVGQIPNENNEFFSDEKLKLKVRNEIENKMVIDEHILSEEYFEHSTPLLLDARFVGEYESSPNHTDIFERILKFLNQ
ncbi:MAG: alpha/beta hydrolase [Bdellovibrionales bacterium]